MPALQSHANLQLSKRRNRKITTSTLEVWQHSAWTPEHCYIRGPVHFQDVKSPNISNTLWCSEAILGHIWPQLHHTHILLMIDLRGHSAWKCNQTFANICLLYVLFYFNYPSPLKSFWIFASCFIFLSAVANNLYEASIQRIQVYVRILVIRGNDGVWRHDPSLGLLILVG